MPINDKEEKTSKEIPSLSELNILDYFAGQAMQALAHVTGDESRSWFGNKIPDNVEDIVAKMSYKFAQSMLEEREKHL